MNRYVITFFERKRDIQKERLKEREIERKSDREKYIEKKKLK